MLTIAGGILIAVMIIGLAFNQSFERMLRALILGCVATLVTMALMGPSDTVQWFAFVVGGGIAVGYYFNVASPRNT